MREVGEQFPGLVWEAEGAGAWHGRLPRWPFPRREPDGLGDLVGEGLEVVVAYGHAYPMVEPSVFPLDPVPELAERTQHEFHVLGDGSLCLLQDRVTWTGHASVTDLLMKAAGWHVEYALMKAGAIQAMSLNGIADDDRHDHLIPAAAAELRSQTGRPA